MILEFIDKRQIEVLTIFGGPSLVKGITRDTLRIEVDPSRFSLKELEDLFTKKYACIRLFTYDTDEGERIRTEIGLGYCVFVSCQEEKREKIYFPGMIMPKEYETVNIVTIAQYTYEEWQEVLNHLETSNDEEEAMIWRYLHE
ncbi:MAG: hypothetical protein NC131_16400 [Roseburia sp.]|nr:hypothetical protein [Roseburia sp.]